MSHDDNNYEWVVVVIPQYTQMIYQLLIQTQCVPRSYHLEGRYGSRTHEYYDNDDDNNDDSNNIDDDNDTTNNTTANNGCENDTNNNNIDDDDEEDKDVTGDADTITSKALTMSTVIRKRKIKKSSSSRRRMIGIPVLSDTHVYKAIKSNVELYSLFTNKIDSSSCSSNNSNNNNNNNHKQFKRQSHQQHQHINNNDDENINQQHDDSNDDEDDDVHITKSNKNNNNKKNRDVYLIYKPYTKSKRQHEPPYFDAQIHIERKQHYSLLYPNLQQLIDNYKSSYISFIQTLQQQQQQQQQLQEMKNNTTAAVPLTSTTLNENIECSWYSTIVTKQRDVDDIITPSASSSTTTKATVFTYGELFAGIGGFTIALNALGGTCIFVSEINDTCRNVYNTNFHSTYQEQDNQKSSSSSSSSSSSNHKIIHGDIYQVLDDELPKPGMLDILVGGFPCQPFSSLGDQPGLDCPDGNLFIQIVRVLNVSQPKAFLFENVPGLLQMSETISTIINAFEECGYYVTMEICDARCLTATTRKRLYIVGISRHYHNINNNTPTTNDIPTFQFPYIPDLQLRARHVIQYDYQSTSSDNNNDDDDDDDDVDILHVSDEQLHRLNTEKYWKAAHLAWPNTVIDTLVSHYGKSVARGHSQLVPCSALLEKNTNPRRFTPRECARLMGFPRTYKIPPKTNNNQGMMAYNKEWYQMFGNAVCPPIVAAISGAILDHCCSIQLLQVQPPPNAVIQLNHQSSTTINDWVEYGQNVAIQLAYDSVLLEEI